MFKIEIVVKVPPTFQELLEKMLEGFLALLSAIGTDVNGIVYEMTLKNIESVE